MTKTNKAQQELTWRVIKKAKRDGKARTESHPTRNGPWRAWQVLQLQRQQHRKCWWVGVKPFFFAWFEANGPATLYVPASNTYALLLLEQDVRHLLRSVQNRNKGGSKTRHLSFTGHGRPNILAPGVMRCFEKLVLHSIKNILPLVFNPRQFACGPSVDAIAMTTLKHLCDNI